MHLKSLNIARNEYGFDWNNAKAGALYGKISFDGNGGEVTVHLQPHHITQILAVVSDSIVSHTRELATNLTREVIEHANTALPKPE